jgi:hypothetical protein
VDNQPRAIAQRARHRNRGQDRDSLPGRVPAETERLIGETNIEEIVNLIVGRKFRSVSAGTRPGSESRS